MLVSVTLGTASLLGWTSVSATPPVHPVRSVTSCMPAWSFRGVDTKMSDDLQIPDLDLSSIDSAGGSGSRALEELQKERMKRLESLGAAEGAVPPPSPPQRLGKFSVSDSAAGQAAAEATLQRLRAKETGEHEGTNAVAIAKAIKVAGQWQSAGLHERAYTELQRVEQFCSFKTQVGANFHLVLAVVAEASGRKAEAKRIRERVLKSAENSSQRWQAEQALGTGASGSFPPSNPELNRLWQMPNSNDW